MPRPSPSTEGSVPLAEAASVDRRCLAMIEWHAKQRQLDRVGDAVRERFGAAALSRGSGRIRVGRLDPAPSMEPSDGLPN